MSRPGSRLVPLALIALLAACGPKEPPVADPASELTAIAAAASDFQKAIHEHNASALAALYDKNAQLLPPGAPIVRGRDAIRKFYADQFAAQVAPITIATNDVAGSGDWAWRAGTWTLETAPPVRGKYIEVWRRTPEGWRLYRDIWNADAQ